VTIEETIKWFEQRPFEPFTVVLINNREFLVPHPEYATLGLYGAVVYVFHPVGQIEVIDASLILSFRTLYKSQISSFEPPPPKEPE
jgi:hypothetical protein